MTESKLINRARASFGSTNVRRSGMSLAYLIIGFTVFVGLVAFGVDVGYVQLVKTELRASVDAANLAGATGLPVSATEARKRAKDAAAANKVGGKPLVLQDSDIELGLWDQTTQSFTPLTEMDESSATAVRVTAHRTAARGDPVPLVFARMIGLNSTDLTISAAAGFAQAADVVLVQDITTSFKEELPDAKIGDQALLDALYASGAGKSNFGVVVHTGWGKTLSPLRQINSNYTYLTNTISGINLAGTSGMPVASGTDISAGLSEAIKVFNDAAYTSYPNTVKAIVLVSDGSPSANTSGSNPSKTDAQLLTLAQQIADQAWAQRIHIYIVFMNADNDAVAAANVKTLTRGSGDFVQVTDPKQLPNALQKLTRRLPMSLLK